MKRFSVLWREPLGLPSCPYAFRYGVQTPWFSIRLHHWLGSDDLRATHDHAWWFLTLVLWGGYDDISPEGVDRLRMGSMRLRSAEHRHTVQIHAPGTWTLLLTGPAVRRWSFYIDGKRLRRDKYFAEHGHHGCPGEGPVRLRPDGTVIEAKE